MVIGHWTWTEKSISPYHLALLTSSFWSSYFDNLPLQFAVRRHSGSRPYTLAGFRCIQCSLMDIANNSAITQPNAVEWSRTKCSFGTVQFAFLLNSFRPVPLQTASDVHNAIPTESYIYIHKYIYLLCSTVSARRYFPLSPLLPLSTHTHTPLLPLTITHLAFTIKW